MARSPWSRLPLGLLSVIGAGILSRLWFVDIPDHPVAGAIGMLLVVIAFGWGVSKVVPRD